MCGAGGVPSVAGGGAAASGVRNLLAIASPPMASFWTLAAGQREERSGDACCSPVAATGLGLAAATLPAAVLYIYSLRTGS